MGLKLALPTPPKMPTREICQVCGDTGIVLLEGRPRIVLERDIWRWQAPCSCSAGDPWRTEAAVCFEPPLCETGCGRVAEVTLTTKPRCLLCDRELRRAS